MSPSHPQNLTEVQGPKVCCRGTFAQPAPPALPDLRPSVHDLRPCPIGHQVSELVT